MVVTRATRTWLMVSALVWALAGGGCGVMNVTRNDEIRLGKQGAAQVEHKYHTYDDSDVDRRGQALAAVCERPDYPYSFRVVEQKDVNAFSLPGGPVFVASALLKFTKEDPDQLSAVLGHEITHVAHRHAVHQIERQQWLGLGIGIFTRGTVQDVASIVANIEELGYSRNQEREADTYGAVYLERIGKDPMVMARMLDRLSMVEGGGGASFLRDHPKSKERAARIRQQIESGEIKRLAEQWKKPQ